MQDFSYGLKGVCPSCGKGKLFDKFLKVNECCAGCGEEYHHHRADDFPAYIVIVIVGHIMVTLALLMEDLYHPPYWVHMAVTLPVTVVLALLLLQPVKGAIVAIQWRMGMHGFRAAKEKRTQSQ